MKALSIWQPWAWAITASTKRVENRQWGSGSPLLAVARSLVGQRIAIHASKGVGKLDDFDDAAEAVIATGKITNPSAFAVSTLKRGGMYWTPAEGLPRGAVVGTARLVEVVITSAPSAHRHPLDIGPATPCMLCGHVGRSTGPCPNADPWAVPDALGLVLDDVEALATPVPFKGAQGWFDVPDNLVKGAAA